MSHTADSSTGSPAQKETHTRPLPLAPSQAAWGCSKGKSKAFTSALTQSSDGMSAFPQLGPQSWPLCFHSRGRDETANSAWAKHCWGPVPGLSSKLADRPPLQGATKASHFGLHLRSSENARPERTLGSRCSTLNFIVEETQALRVKELLQYRGQKHISVSLARL